MTFCCGVFCVLINFFRFSVLNMFYITCHLIVKEKEKGHSFKMKERKRGNQLQYGNYPMVTVLIFNCEIQKYIKMKCGFMGSI